MIEIISETYPVARKRHYCSASEALRDALKHVQGELTFAERRAVALARRNNWRIQPGEPYLRQRNTADGELWTFKAIPAIDRICQRLKLYDDE